MDPRKRQQLETAIEQGETFSRITRQPDWPYLRTWIEKAIHDYETQVHLSSNRTDHLALVRALEGHEALASILHGMDRAITDVPKHRKEIDDADNGTATAR